MIVLKDGRLVEEGSPSALSHVNGYFTKLKLRDPIELNVPTILPAPQAPKGRFSQ